MHRIERRLAGEIGFVGAKGRVGKASPDQWAADAVVGVSSDREPALIQLPYVIAAVSRRRDHQSIVGLVQGHSAGSPDAVGCTPAVGNATDERRVIGQIVTPQRIAGRNAGELGLRGDRQGRQGREGKQAHRHTPRLNHLCLLELQVLVTFLLNFPVRIRSYLFPKVWTNNPDGTIARDRNEHRSGRGFYLAPSRRIDPSNMYPKGDKRSLYRLLDIT